MPASKQSQEHAVVRAGKIFAILRQAAERGEPCPADGTLAERFGVGTSAIVSAFNFLAANGMIEIDRTSNGRVVSICSAGQTTASALVRRAA